MHDPLFYVLEGTHIYEWEGEENAWGSSVVGLGDVSEPFLAGGVPDLQFDGFIVVGDNFGLKIDSDSCGVGWVESLIGKSSDEWGFSNSSVPNDKYFGEVVVLFFRDVAGVAGANVHIIIK